MPRFPGFVSGADTPDTATHVATHKQYTTYTMPRFPGEADASDTAAHTTTHLATHTQHPTYVMPRFAGFVSKVYSSSNPSS